MPKTATGEVGADGRAGFRICFTGDLASAWAAYEFRIYERIASSAERFSGIAGLARSTVMQTKAVPAVRDLREDDASYWIEDAGSSLYDAYLAAAPGSPSFRYSPKAYVDLLDAALQRYRELHMAGIVHLDVAFRNIVCPINPDGALRLADLRIIDFCDAVVHVESTADGAAPHLVPPAPRFAGRAARPDRNDDNLCRAIDALRAQARDDLLNRLSVHVDLASLFATLRADVFEDVFAAGGPAFKQTFDAMRRFLIADIQAQSRSNGQADDALMAYLLPPGVRQTTADIDSLYRQLWRYVQDLRQAAPAASKSPGRPLNEGPKENPEPSSPPSAPHATLRSVTPDSMSAFAEDSDHVEPAPKFGAESDVALGRSAPPSGPESVATAASNAGQRTAHARSDPEPSKPPRPSPASPRPRRVKPLIVVVVAAAALVSALWLGMPIDGHSPSGSDNGAAADAQILIPGPQAAAITPAAEQRLRVIPGAATYRPGGPLTFTVDSDTSCLLQVVVVDAQGYEQRLVPQNPGEEFFLLPGDRYQQHFPDSASVTLVVGVSSGPASLRANCTGDQGTETAEARIRVDE